MFALKVLSVCLRIWHLRPTDWTGVYESLGRRGLLVGALSFLEFRLFLCVLLLALNLLVTSRHL